MSTLGVTASHLTRLEAVFRDLLSEPAPVDLDALTAHDMAATVRDVAELDEQAYELLNRARGDLAAVEAGATTIPAHLANRMREVGSNAAAWAEAHP